MTPTSARRFLARVETRSRGGIAFMIPFEPADAWGELDAYHVSGTVGGQHFRGHLTHLDPGWSMRLGPSWCRAPGFRAGDEVEISLAPEGPRSTTMGDDVALAFGARPGPARFFDSLPTFYRKDFERWIESAKQPETRARRIAETVALADQGRRER